MVVTIFIIAVGWGRFDLAAQNPNQNLSPSDQLVVLKNGEILRGQVTRNAEQVIIRTNQGSRLVLAAERTDFVCNSMDEAYWGKCARVKASDLNGQKRLFHWCVKNRMLDHAQNQIDILLQSDIKATELEYLDRQLNVALIQQSKVKERLVRQASQQQLAKEKRDSADAPVNSSQLVLTPIEMNASIGTVDLASRIDTNVFRPLPSLNAKSESSGSIFSKLPSLANSEQSTNDENPIRQVGFEEAIEYDTISPDHRQAAASSPESPKAAELTDDRIMVPIAALDQETRSMPEGSLRHYRQRVERVLANHCGDCHTTDSRVMPLFQVGRSQSIPRRQSQRNLHNVLKYVDRQQPFESRLLLAATAPHAGAEEPILTPGTDHYDNLKLWLIMLSDDPRMAVMQARRLPVSEPTTSIGVTPVKPEPAGLMPLGDASNAFPATIGEIPSLDSSKNDFKPIDPFDPEIFNRTYGDR